MLSYRVYYIRTLPLESDIDAEASPSLPESNWVGISDRNLVAKTNQSIKFDPRKRTLIRLVLESTSNEEKTMIQRL